MPNNNLSYPKVCKRKDGKYFVDFKLNNKRYRLFSGRIIGSSLYPNTYPAKQRYSVTSTLAKQVYAFIVSNDYSLIKPLSKSISISCKKLKVLESDISDLNSEISSIDAF